MSRTESTYAGLSRILWPALIVGVIGLALCALGAYLSPDQFFPSYLFACLFWLGISLGGMAIVMLYHLAGGAWGFVVLRVMETAAMLLPLMALLFVPLFFGLSVLYPWARPASVAGDPVLQHKSAYLDPLFFTVRVAVYFAIWIGMAYLLNRWSFEQDRTDDPALARRMRDLSRFGLVVYVLTLTFSSIDWAMSLEPDWYSTIYGLIYLAGQGIAGFSFAILVTSLLSRRSPLAEVLTPSRLNDLGNLLLVFVMFWAYISLSQYLLIWSGNLPEEVVWYTRRIQGGWRWVIVFVIFFQFVLPFLLLLSRRTKTTVRTLAALAALVLFVHLVDLFWLIVPPFRPQGLSFHWLDLAAPIGVGGIWVATFVWLLRRRAILPLHDPRVASFQEAVEHG